MLFRLSYRGLDLILAFFFPILNQKEGKINFIDWIIIGLILLFILDGALRGFFDALFLFFQLIISLTASFVLCPFLGNVFITKLSLSIGIANFVAFLTIFLFLQIILSVIFSIIVRKLVLREKLWWRVLAKYDRLVAGLVGIFNGAIIVSIFLIINLVLPLSANLKNELLQSKLAHPFIKEANILNEKLRTILEPAVDESEIVLRNLVNYLIPGQEGSDKISFPKDLNTSIDIESENRMLVLVNQVRQEANLKPLVSDRELVAVSRVHSKEMFDLSYFDHISPVTGSPFERLKKAEIDFTFAGENIAYAPDVEIAHWGLMNSKSHRENILSSNYRKVGIGVISAGIWGKMFTQTFSD